MPWLHKTSGRQPDRRLASAKHARHMRITGACRAYKKDYQHKTSGVGKRQCRLLFEQDSLVAPDPETQGPLFQCRLLLDCHNFPTAPSNVTSEPI